MARCVQRVSCRGAVHHSQEAGLRRSCRDAFPPQAQKPCPAPQALTSLSLFRYVQLRRQNVLAKFYENPERYAYSFQHYVLISRMEQARLPFVDLPLLSSVLCWLAAAAPAAAAVAAAERRSGGSSCYSSSLHAATGHASAHPACACTGAATPVRV